MDKFLLAYIAVTVNVGSYLHQVVGLPRYRHRRDLISIRRAIIACRANATHRLPVGHVVALVHHAQIIAFVGVGLAQEILVAPEPVAVDPRQVVDYGILTYEKLTDIACGIAQRNRLAERLGKGFAEYFVAEIEDSGILSFFHIGMVAGYAVYVVGMVIR